jgi:hypothetical protein
VPTAKSLRSIGFPAFELKVLGMRPLSPDQHGSSGRPEGPTPELVFLDHGLVDRGHDRDVPFIMEKQVQEFADYVALDRDCVPGAYPKNKGVSCFQLTP